MYWLALVAFSSIEVCILDINYERFNNKVPLTKQAVEMEIPAVHESRTLPDM